MIVDIWQMENVSLNLMFKRPHLLCRDSRKTLNDKDLIDQTLDSFSGHQTALKD